MTLAPRVAINFMFFKLVFALEAFGVHSAFSKIYQAHVLLNCTRRAAFGWAWEHAALLIRWKYIDIVQGKIVRAFPAMRSTSETIITISHKIQILIQVVNTREKDIWTCQ